MSVLIIFHFNLQSCSSLLKMDLKLKLEYNYRILLKKYSCVRVSISFSRDLECWKEDKLWKQGEICFSHQSLAIVFGRQWIPEKAKHIYFCPVTRAVTFWHSSWTLPLPCSWYKVKEYLIVIWSKVLQFGLNGSWQNLIWYLRCGVPFGTRLWRCNLERSFFWYWHARKLFLLVSVCCQVLKCTFGR